MDRKVPDEEIVILPRTEAREHEKHGRPTDALRHYHAYKKLVDG